MQSSRDVWDKVNAQDSMRLCCRRRESSYVSTGKLDWRKVWFVNDGVWVIGGKNCPHYQFRYEKGWEERKAPKEAGLWITRWD